MLIADPAKLPRFSDGERHRHTIIIYPYLLKVLQFSIEMATWWSIMSEQSNPKGASVCADNSTASTYLIPFDDYSKPATYSKHFKTRGWYLESVLLLELVAPGKDIGKLWWLQNSWGCHRLVTQRAPLAGCTFPDPLLFPCLCVLIMILPG